MTGADLIDLLLATLVRGTGRSRGHWRRVLGPVKRYPRDTHAHCNWQIDPTGTAADIDLVERTLDRVRAEHPYID